MREFELPPGRASEPNGPAPSRPSPSPAANLLRLQATAGNAAVLTIFRDELDGGTSLPGGIAPKPNYTSQAEVHQDMVVDGQRDWQRLFYFANGRSMPDMVALWQDLQAGGLLQETLVQVDSAKGFNNPRMKIAIQGVLAHKQSSRIMFELDHEPQLATLEPDAANAILDAIHTEHPIVPRLRAAAGFKALTPDEQRRILVYAAGSTTLSTGGADGFTTVLDDPKKAADPEAFRKVLHSQPGIAEVASAPMPPEGVEVTQEPAVGVNGHPFHSGPANANKIVVHITDPSTATAFNQNKIEVYEPQVAPAATVGVLPSVAEVVSMIRRMPKPARASVVRVNLNPARNPDDKIWANTPGYKEEGKDFRSYMTAGADGVVDIYPTATAHGVADMVAGISHESGHAVSIRLWGDPNQVNPNPPQNPTWMPWWQAMQSDGFVASKYARASIMEDFAEAWMMYTLSRRAPARHAEVRTLMPARSVIMDGILKTEHTE